jgi:hypothetical protein
LDLPSPACLVRAGFGGIGQVDVFGQARREAAFVGADRRIVALYT